MAALISQLNAILLKNAGTRVNGKVASERTKSAIGESLRSSFRRLVLLNYRLQNPENLSEKHVKALCEYWYSNAYSVKTIQVNLSYLRIFCRWVGKADMVKGVAHYLPDVPPTNLRVRTAALNSKSWASNGIDVATKVKEADAIDKRFGAMLRLAVAFGLRRHEIIECCPWKVDRGDRFAAYKTKGGRPRDIYIDTPEQRIVLDHVKSLVKKSEHLGWTTKDNGHASDIKFCLGKWHRMLAKIGITKAMSNVTGHGLRAQYAENATLIASVIPPTLGGSGGQMNKEDLSLKRVQISESLGHSRESITSAYYGSFGRSAPPDAADRTKRAIAAAVPAFSVDQLDEIPDDRVKDCIQLTAELMAVGAYADPRIIHALWQHHSSRHCTPWLGLEHDNIAALEAASNHFTSRAEPIGVDN